MKLRIFESEQGECLLLTASDGTNVLAGGGSTKAFQSHFGDFLGRMARDGEELDLVYLSHVAPSAIQGVLKLLDAEKAWLVYDYQVGSGNFHCKTPRTPRPPVIKSLWHNGFKAQLPEDTEEISSMLAYSASGLAMKKDSWAQLAASNYAELAHCESTAVTLSRQIGKQQLNIPLNPEYGGELMVVMPPPDPIAVGNLEITVLGPFQEDIDELRRDWGKWLRETENRQQQASVPNRRSRESRSEIDELVEPILAFAKDWRSEEEARLPPLSSLKLLIEDDSNSVLMCGAGTLREVEIGLQVTQKMREDGTLHVRAMKMPGEALDPKSFGQHITAEHYLFCDVATSTLSSVKTVLDSRLGSAAKRSLTPEVDEPFTLWFNQPAPSANGKAPAERQKMFDFITQQAQKHKGRLNVKTMPTRANSLTLDLNE